ncbi:MAG TPA: heavy metal translocating P-type ATPase, partial [Daejeonella sp.]|nr:heavy metal translocating P-type ATPase [Daejeonella sp.]
MKSNTRHTECCSTDIDEQPGNSGNQKIAQAEGHKHGTLVAGWRSHWNLLLSFLILLVMLVLEYGFNTVFPDLISLLIFGTAYLLAGWTVLDLAFRKLKRFDIFNEFFLMSVATIGAFLIGEYSEGVAVMVFYSVGEWFQDSAVNRAKRSIKALLDIRPDEVTVIREGTENRVDPLTVELDEAILI